MTQLQANLSEKSILERKRQNEFYIKTAKNSSSVFQACDTGDGHMDTRRNFCASSKQPAPDNNCGVAFDRVYRHLADAGMLALESAAIAEIRAIVV